MKVHKHFRKRVGKDVFFLSISIDSHVDTPEVLAGYREAYDRPWIGWYHLTGDYDEIESLRWILGVYDEDPVANDPILMAFRAQLDATVPLSNQPAMGSTWEPLARAIRRVMRGAATPESALDQAQQEYEIITRPPPESANPAGAIAAAVLVLIGLAIWFFRRISHQREEIRQWRFAYRWVLPATSSSRTRIARPRAPTAYSVC